MSFAILILCLILSGLGTVIALIFSIIFLSTSKSKQALISLVIFIVLLSSAILSLIEITERIGRAASTITEKVIDGKDFLKKWKDSLKVEIKDHHHSRLRDSLESYIPKSIRDTMNENFWETYYDEYRVMPLIYPYQIETSESFDEGGTVICFNKKMCLLDKLPFRLDHITALNLDRNFLLLRKDNTIAGKNKNELEADVFYLVFDTRTGAVATAANEKQLMKEAEKAGYKGEKELKTIRDFYEKL